MKTKQQLSITAIVLMAAFVNPAVASDSFVAGTIVGGASVPVVGTGGFSGNVSGIAGTSTPWSGTGTQIGASIAGDVRGWNANATGFGTSIAQAQVSPGGASASVTSSAAFQGSTWFGAVNGASQAGGSAFAFR